MKPIDTKQQKILVRINDLVASSQQKLDGSSFHSHKDKAAGATEVGGGKKAGIKRSQSVTFGAGKRTSERVSLKKASTRHELVKDCGDDDSRDSSNDDKRKKDADKEDFERVLTNLRKNDPAC